MTVFTDLFARAVDYARNDHPPRKARTSRSVGLLRAAILLLAFVAPQAWSHEIQPSPSCSKPYKPSEFEDESELDEFKDDVERYKRRIQEFVDEQNEAAETHRKAADEAIDEWNRYVRYELNQ